MVVSFCGLPLAPPDCNAAFWEIDKIRTTKKDEKGHIVNTCTRRWIWVCLVSVLIPSRKHPISPSRNHHETAMKIPLQLPGFARHVLGRNLASTSRPTRGWVDGLVGPVFLGLFWVDSLGFVSQISLILILGLIFFWRTMKRKEILPEKWLEKCSCFLVWLEAWQILESYYSFCSTRLATYQPFGMSCRYFCESSMSVILCIKINRLNACPGTQCTGDCLKAFASDLSFCHSKIYDYPRINIWLLKLDSRDTDLPGCYVATSTIPTATPEGSKFTSRSMAWGVQFHRVRMEASTLKDSNSLPNNKPRKHLLHVEELRYDLWFPAKTMMGFLGKIVGAY